MIEKQLTKMKTILKQIVIINQKDIQAKWDVQQKQLQDYLAPPTESASSSSSSVSSNSS